MDSSSPLGHPSPKRRVMLTMSHFVIRRTPWVIPLVIQPLKKKGLWKFGGEKGGKKPQARKPMMENEVLNLEPGEWVEVLSEKEIMATLDQEGKSRGLRFMPEMRKYCGKRFRVFKQVKKIILDPTGEMRQMKIPTVYLEGSYCDGEFHQGCDRYCFVLWREGWLKRAPPVNQEGK